MARRASLFEVLFASALFAAVLAGGARADACDTDAGFSVPADRVSALARGFNLNGWLDVEDGVAPDPLVLAELRQKGFTHIRLPIQPARFTTAFSSADDVARNFAELDDAIDRLHRLGFAVSLDLQPGPPLGRVFDEAPEAGLRLVEVLWRQIARRYADRSPDVLYFEVLNEPPVPALDWENWGPKLVEAIRREAPDHTIIYALTRFQRLDEMTARQPLPAENVVYAAHYYDPMVFTHQGNDWDDGPLADLRGVPFPLRASDPRVGALLDQLREEGRDGAAEALSNELDSPWDESRIAEAVAEAAKWGQRNRVPIVINEFGTLSWVAPRKDRLRWYGAVRRHAEAACMGWAVWDYAHGFGFVQRENGREIPDADMLAVLFGDLTEAQGPDG